MSDSIISIACPKCGSELRLRDPKLLGKTGKCPKCAHRFVLEEPDEVELELADAPRPAPTKPLVGQAAQWVPDETSPAPRTAAAVDPSVARLRQLKKRKNKTGALFMQLGIVAVVLAAVGGGVVYFANQSAEPPQVAKNKPKPRPAASAESAAEEVPVESDATPRANREPISLLFVPSGARIVVHLRPAEFFSAGGVGAEEYFYSLSQFGVWLKEQVQTLCKEDPAKIEEVLFCFLGGSRNEAPELAIVVRLKEDAKKSALLDRFGGERLEENGRPYYADENHAYLIVDLKTYAICPKPLASEMVQAFNQPLVTDDAVEALLRESDRSKPFSIIFVPRDIELEAEFLAAENVRPFLGQVIEWLSQDGEVEGVLWSIAVGEKLTSEFVIRNSTVVREHKLRDNLKAKLQGTPKQILAAIQQMTPQRNGKFRLIGRVPAMSQVYAQNTKYTTGDRLVTMTTVLPERALPNLALGTLLAWDESTRTNFAKPGTPGGSESETKVPDKLADRLKTKIDVDFRREPLFSAYDYIAKEASFKVVIDGDGLKDAGYTKNMPQTFKFDAIQSGKAIQEILKSYDKMCIVLDEGSKTVTVTTFKFAEQKGQTPHKF